MSANAFAATLGVPINRITTIIRGQRGITADTALRLARYLGTSAEPWMNLQRNFDLRRAERQVGAMIEREVTPRAIGAHCPFLAEGVEEVPRARIFETMIQILGRC